MALKLVVALGTSAEVWMGLQMDYDLDMAREKY
jgi:plasmid maintenance system antidote protein VapI